MASIIKTSINLNEIPKDKIINGKKGKYLPITITLNDELDQFGNQGPVIVSQSKEEREGKATAITPRRPSRTRTCYKRNDLRRSHCLCFACEESWRWMVYSRSPSARL